MSEYEERIKSQGTPKQQQTLNYYLQQIAIQRLKEEKDITAYQAKKQKQYDRLKEEHNRLSRRWDVIDRTTGFQDNISRAEGALLLAKMNTNLTEQHEVIMEMDKEVDRRRDIYQTKVRWFLLKIEALAKKVKLG